MNMVMLIVLFFFCDTEQGKAGSTSVRQVRAPAGVKLQPETTSRKVVVATGMLFHLV